MTDTAKALGLERSHLYKKCQALGIDLRAMRTPVPRDPIHARLVEFMRRYYGIHLEYDAPAEASSADRTRGLDDVDELEARRNMSLLSE